MIALHLGLSLQKTENICTDERTCNLIGKVCNEAISRLEKNQSSLEVVAEAVAALEDSDLTNAGYGSSLTWDGSVEMEAGVMEGCSSLFGGVSCVSNFKNPVKIAHQVVYSQKIAHSLVHPQYYSGSGVDKFASGRGFEPVSNLQLRSPSIIDKYDKYRKLFSHEHSNNTSQNESSFDTVGAIVVDLKGNISVAASSGGSFMRPIGRVGHVSLPGGAGIWADRNANAAACTTGLGEYIARESIAKKLVELSYFDIDHQYYQTFSDEINKLYVKPVPTNWYPTFGGILLKTDSIKQANLIAFASEHQLVIGFQKIHSSFKIDRIIKHHSNGSPVIQIWKV